MEDVRHAATPEDGQYIAIVFQAQPFAPDMDADTKQMIMSMNLFKGVFKGVAVADKPVSVKPVVWWLIGDPKGTAVWRVRRDQIGAWTPMPSLNQA